MKALMITPSYHPIIGGAETAVRNLAMGLNNMGVHTDVMTFHMDKAGSPKWNGQTEMSSDGFQVFRIPALNWIGLARSWKVTMGVNLIPGRFRHLLKTYDILHYHAGDLSFPVFSSLLRKPRICQLHGLDIDFLRRYSIAKLLLKHTADIFLSPTKQMKTDLVKLGISEDKIAYLPNSVDTDAFRPDGEKEAGLLLFVGRMSSGKGVDVLLNSLKRIETPVKLAIIGPPDWDPKYFNDILRMIEEENLRGKHKVEYLGSKNHQDIIKWYQRASIFVLPPIRYEALGIVNLEALACETPVVATDVGGIHEVVHSGENGILVERSNTVKLANAIQYLLDNEDVRKKFGEKGRELVVNSFSTKVTIQKLIKIYQQLLAPC
jgi:glycosyltransferase involved in cell wall biosynthesis